MEPNTSSFLKTLKQVPENSNPFAYTKYLTSNFNIWDGISDQYIPKKDVRCPICLSLIIYGARPNSCYHAFCYYCIKKWEETKRSCPYCRKKFSSILKLNMTENFLSFQGEYFAKY